MRVCRLLWALSPALTMHVFVGCCYRPVPLPCTAALPQDILKKEDGAYLKYAMGSMLDIRYQVRAGLLAAGNFGVPQGRWRCFMWAAAPGQQLPALPKPTHNCVDFNVSRQPAGGAEADCVVHEPPQRCALPCVLAAQASSCRAASSTHCIPACLPTSPHLPNPHAPHPPPPPPPTHTHLPRCIPPPLPPFPLPRSAWWRWRRSSHASDSRRRRTPP